MKQYEITQHPIKLTLELDDDFLHTIGVDDSDMDDMAAEWETNIKQVAVQLYLVKSQMEASEKMKNNTPPTS